MRVLSLGACQLSAPINTLLARERIRDCWIDAGLRSVSCYCVGDAVQALRLGRAELIMPDGLKFYFGFDDLPVGQDRRSRLDTAEIAIIDCNTPIMMCMDDVFINRSIITRKIYKPLAARDPELGKTYDVWWHKGIFGGDEELKCSAARTLLPFLKDTVEYPEVAAEILLRMRGRRQSGDDLVKSLRELREELGVPLAMITSIYRYLPDGRPVSWPAGHLEMTKAAARELKIPLFDTTALVQRHGVSVAMNDALTEYRPEFSPVVGDALLEFMGGMLEADASGKTREGSLA